MMKEDCLNDMPKYPLEIEERVIWLQKAITCIEDASLKTDALSDEIQIKKTKLDQALKLLHIQRVLRDKLRKREC